MDILRVYDPAECDAAGVPLDWERCRACEGTGKPVYTSSHGRVGVCQRCDGHGSLKAAALWEYGGYGPTKVMQIRLPDDHVFRCEGCGHPMSEGTWKADSSDLPSSVASLSTPQAVLRAALRELREGVEPWKAWVKTFERRGASLPPVHYSPCDEGCSHGGPGRVFDGDGDVWPVLNVSPTLNTTCVGVPLRREASWRSVDVRTFGWPHDLRPEKLAVLCIRCYAERTRND